MKFVFEKHNSIYKGKKLLFLDRDGVVIKDTGYPHKKNEIQFNFKIIENLVILKNTHNIEIVGFVTNQSGVERGFFSEKQFWDTHLFIIEKCKLLGMEINFTCVSYFKSKNFYRKPSNGMIIHALKYYSGCKKKSIMVGDKETDKIAAKKSNLLYYDVEKFNY